MIGRSLFNLLLSCFSVPDQCLLVKTLKHFSVPLGRYIISRLWPYHICQYDEQKGYAIWHKPDDSILQSAITQIRARTCVGSTLRAKQRRRPIIVNLQSSQFVRGIMGF